MDPLRERWKSLIQDNYAIIIEALYPDHVMDKLVSKRILSHAIIEEIEHLVKRKKNRAILDRICGQTEVEIQQFISCLLPDEPALYQRLLDDADRQGLLNNGRLPLEVQTEGERREYYTDTSQYLPYPMRVASQMSGMNLSSNTLAHSVSTDTVDSDASGCGTGPTRCTARKDFSP